MSSLTIKNIKIENYGQKVLYDYDISPDIKQYFNENFFIEYDIDVSDVPKSILVIPFVANLLPISWFVGFDIVLDNLDFEFYNCISTIKEVFANEFPQILKNKSQVICANLEKNHSSTEKSAMLFSGGVDAYATYLKNKSNNPDLILIRGAEIPVDDKVQWERAKYNVESEAFLLNNFKHYISMNCREFYSYRVLELVTGGGWWGVIQHGLCLICALAPISQKLGYGTVKIAATHSNQFRMFWGSMPEIDENIRWADTKVRHDGFDMSRMDKVEFIVNNAKHLNKKFTLRVCYSEFNSDINCSECEKCLRTMTAIAILNENPNKYGFKFTKKFYNDVENLLKNGFSTEGIRYAWYGILCKLKTQESIYNIDGDSPKDIKTRLEKQLIQGLTLPIKVNISNSHRIKRKIIGRFPKVFKIYLKIRGNFR